jgi:hypothetical protein
MTTEQLLRFWDVAQARLARDERNRLAGLFGAFTDALRHVVVPLWAGKKAPRPERPWYLLPEGGSPAGLAQLRRDFPGNVAGPPVFEGVPQ